MRKLKLTQQQCDDLIEVITDAAHQTIRAAPSDEGWWQSPGEKWFELFLQSVEQQVIEDE